MPNKNSKASHIPLRTCVVCRQKSSQDSLMSFFVLSSGLVFDFQRTLQCRKYYLCPDSTCLSVLPKWRKKHKKLRIQEA